MYNLPPPYMTKEYLDNLEKKRRENPQPQKKTTHSDIPVSSMKTPDGRFMYNEDGTQLLYDYKGNRALGKKKRNSQKKKRNLQKKKRNSQNKASRRIMVRSRK